MNKETFKDICSKIVSNNDKEVESAYTINMRKQKNKTYLLQDNFVKALEKLLENENKDFIKLGKFIYTNLKDD